MPVQIVRATKPEPSSEGAPTLISHVYELVRRGIIDGTFLPGERLRVEHLRADYQVAASTMREALLRLVADGLATMEGQRGFRVAPMSVEDLEDVTRLRVILEREALSEAIQKGDVTWESQIVAAFHALTSAEKALRLASPEALPQAIVEWEQRNGKFHSALVSACTSQRLLRLREMLYQQHERYRRRAVELRTERQNGAADMPRDVHVEHGAIMNAALKRDEQLALALLEAHIRTTATTVAQGLAATQD